MTSCSKIELTKIFLHITLWAFLSDFVYHDSLLTVDRVDDLGGNTRTKANDERDEEIHSEALYLAARQNGECLMLVALNQDGGCSDRN